VSPQAEQFWRRIAEAYQPTPFEAFLFIALLSLLVGGLVYYTVRRSRRERQQQVNLSQKLFDEKATERSLSPSQIELLKDMSRYLRDQTQIHQLVTDEISFNAAARKLREDEGVGPQAIAALRVKLDFQSAREHRMPRSSATIPEGTTVLVQRNRYRRPVRARVLKPSPNAFRIRLLEEGARLPAGAAVDIYHQSSAGVYTFRTTVLAEKADGVALSHSEELRRYQKRRYYRRKLRLPVQIERLSDGRRFVSNFHDIGGGGASIANQEGILKSGDEVELRFKPDRELIKLTGNVVRMSDSGRTAHINYEHIRESLRDKIYHAIFKPAADEIDPLAHSSKESE
jgi:hypothetical protein